MAAMIGPALSEHLFWLQIMGDHARFILYALAPVETETIGKAQQYIQAYDRLLEMAAGPSADADEINQQARELTLGFREFKLSLLTLTLRSQIKLSLSSSLLGHMINELEEYLLVIQTMMNGQSPEFNALHYHMLWLSDAVAHSSVAAAGLDEAETDLQEQALGYEHTFTGLTMKTMNLQGFTRTGLTYFPSLTRLNAQADAAIRPFMHYLGKLLEGRLTGSVLGTLLPLMADHMEREECYYLHKLSQVAENVRKPDCDPAKPRIER